MTAIFDSFNSNPSDELRSSWERQPSSQYSGNTLVGRVICAWKLCYHSIAIVAKPAMYMTLSLISCIADALFRTSDPNTSINYFQPLRMGFLLTSLVAPIGQTLQICKAAMGIFHPAFYFKEDDLHPYFLHLAAIAKELEGEPDLIEMFEKGASILEGVKPFYRTSYKNCLEVICSKLNDSTLSQNEKMVVLKMFAPLPSDPEESGIYACPPGVGRLLEQICACLDIPKDPKKILPWLETQFKEETLHRLVMQAEASDQNMQDLHAANFGNLLISNLGERIGLPQEMIDNASRDFMVKMSCLSESEKQDWLKQFNQLYTEEVLEAYLIERINSQSDGKPGLKDFRNHVIQVLTEQVSESEIESSKKEVQDKLGISEALADEPIFYVKLHYFLHPDANPSDENASDLNQKGIRAFAATLQNNPFDYFAANAD